MKPGHVLVVRGMGPKGGPGMARPRLAASCSRSTPRACRATSRSSRDGQLSGLCNKGLTVAEVSPESAVGGPLALVEDGDRIDIDVDGALARAATCPRRSWPRGARGAASRALPQSTGYLSIYQRSVQPMSTGAVLIKQP